MKHFDSLSVWYEDEVCLQKQLISVFSMSEWWL